MTELPSRVTIYEVGPRDGLQNEKGIVPVAAKAEFVQRLLAAGLPIVEATSFVHPKWVPQLADAGELMTRLIDGPLGDTGKDLPVLVPNERGLDRARGLVDDVPVTQFSAENHVVRLEVAGRRVQAVVNATAHSVEVVVEGQRFVF